MLQHSVTDWDFSTACLLVLCAGGCAALRSRPGPGGPSQWREGAAAAREQLGDFSAAAADVERALQVFRDEASEREGSDGELR